MVMPKLSSNWTARKGEYLFPAHLHFKSFNTPDIEVASLLTPVSATSGHSITDLEYLSDETKMIYADLISFDGHIKIHLGDGTIVVNLSIVELLDNE